MKIVRIFGGLGNQMFQYALAIALQAKNEDVRIDATCMRGYPLHNGFELNQIFKISINQASIFEILKVAYPLPHYRLWQLGKRSLPKRNTMILEGKEMTFNPKVFIPNNNLMIEGYWQSEKYFFFCRNDILNAFTFPDFINDSNNHKLANRIRHNNAVSIHVRRGDYLRISSTSGICTEEYYNNAINLIIEKVNPDLFVFFSDDIEWCKNHFKSLSEFKSVEFVDWNSGKESYRDMQLMSICSHNIIANSSFSWWGAWLNQNPEKIVITPSRWMNGRGLPHIIAHNWIPITV